jgi:3-hydroxyisobutyrate dehydrogenase-like beta-hydroxyacid dehydrogenase
MPGRNRLVCRNNGIDPGSLTGVTCWRCGRILFDGDKQEMKLGWIGLGNMGLPIARNLLKAGHEVTVYNRTRSRAEELAKDGAKIAGSPAEAAAAGIVATMVADDNALEEVTLGKNGLIQGLLEGGIHISMSTVSVAISRRLEQAHAAAGQALVSAPVFGRPEAAAAAKLAVVVAGQKAAVEQLRPVWEAIGQGTFIFGEEPHLANVIKLSGNFLIGSVLECLGEAIALIRKYGIDPQEYLNFLTSTLFAAPVYKTYGSLIVEDKFQPVGFKMHLGLKDIRLALAAGEAASVPLPVASLLRDRMLSAIANGRQDDDWASVARLAAEQAGLKKD